MKNNSQSDITAGIKQRKKVSRQYLRLLSPAEKIARLVDLQEQYYQMLVVRKKNGDRPIPEKWQKWHKARYENANVSELI